MIHMRNLQAMSVNELLTLQHSITAELKDRFKKISDAHSKATKILEEPLELPKIKVVQDQSLLEPRPLGYQDATPEDFINFPPEQRAYEKHVSEVMRDHP